MKSAFWCEQRDTGHVTSPRRWPRTHRCSEGESDPRGCLRLPHSPLRSATESKESGGSLKSSEWASAPEIVEIT